MSNFGGQRYCEPHDSTLCECDLYEPLEISECENCGVKIIDGGELCNPCGIADSIELLKD